MSGRAVAAEKEVKVVAWQGTAMTLSRTSEMKIQIDEVEAQ